MRNGGDSRVPQMDTEVLRETFDVAARRTSVAEARHRSLAWLARHAVAQQAAQTAVLVVSEGVDGQPLDDEGLERSAKLAGSAAAAVL